MRVFQTTALVTPDGELRIAVLDDITSGKYSIVVVLDETTGPAPQTDESSNDDLPLPTYDLGTWQLGTSLSRKDLYDDWAR